MSDEKSELLIKSFTWWWVSTLIAMFLTYIFIGNVSKSAVIVIFNGLILMIFQWIFEIIWNKHARERIRNVISRK
jgi:hypothetical protein